MQKNALCNRYAIALILSDCTNRFLTKTARVMQLTAFLLTVCCLSVAARTVSQSITYSGRNVKLETVFDAIEKQTGYFVFFGEELVDIGKPVNVEARNMPLQDFLNEILKGQPFTYSLKKTTITIARKSGKKLNLPSIIEEIDALPVRGTVRGPDGQPLAGANVVIKGTNKGTVTSADGRFIIEASIGDTLIISSIGYIRKEFAIHSEGPHSFITLAISESKLDEIQITAYGSTTKRYNTGNITTITSEEIAKQPVNNPLYALQARVPGLQITPTSGLPGASVKLQIRGKNSLRFETEPLIVIDGLPIKNDIPGLGFEGLPSNVFSALNFLNPNDILSMEVLKDADATSIYGSRGANGVILITTKKGKAGDTRINLNAQVGFAEVPTKIDVLNTQQYLELRKEAFANSGVDIATLNPNETNADITRWDQTRYTDWQNVLIGGTAKYHDMSGSVTGGNALVQYVMGGNFHKETSVFPGDNSDIKGSAYMRLAGVSTNQKLKTSIGLSYMGDKNTLPQSDLTNVAVTFAPNAPSLYKTDGGLNWEPLASGARSWYNPLYNPNGYSAKVNNLVANAEVSYKIVPGVTLKLQGGYNDLKGNAFRIINPFKDRSPEDANTPGAAYFNTNGVKNMSVEPQANYQGKIGPGIIDALIGASWQNTTTESLQIFAVGATSDALIRNLAASNAYVELSNSSSQYKYAAVFGRINYNWNNKYLINLTARRDGSSRFGPGNQFGNFGSVGTAWIFSEEDFIKSSVPSLSFGKLRFSYGTSGNDAIGDYQYLERYTPIVEGPYQESTGYMSAGLFNAYYAWEVTKKMELGLELGLLKDRILLTGSYFRNRSDNQLINYPYPSMAGPGSPLYNLPALIQNTGIEIVLSTDNIKSKNFNWSTSINFTRNRNKLLEFPNLESSPFVGANIGQPFTGSSQVFKSAGVDPTTGMYQFLDMNKNITPNPADVTRPDGGKYVRVMTTPEFYGGVANAFSFKGLTLDVLFQFTKQMGTSPLTPFLSIVGTLKNVPIEFINRWQKPGDIKDIQKVYSRRPVEYRSAAERVLASDFTYVDASFIRLKNLSISYQIPGSWKESLKLKDIRIYVHGQNLWTITDYKGLDPETQSMSTLPPLRVVVFGLNVTL